MYIIKLLFVNDDIVYDDYKYLEKYVGDERKKRISLYKFENDKLLSLFAALMVRYDILNTFSISNNDIAFTYGEYKKPHFSLGDSNFHFSVSHTKGVVAYARHTKKCGIDVEGKQIDKYNIAESYFTPDEFFYIRSSDDADNALTEIWTKKEAYIKMLGTGLYTSLESFNVISSDISDTIFSFNKNGFTISFCSEAFLEDGFDISEMTPFMIADFFDNL